ncbi:winged helix-turn-helix domain-containing protein [Rhizobium sp. Root1220]|uniref:winged helix-turn-helix domain-containing protein n=1 Tax=Rhizobium sp. Root1220 TaxID=1736432 RepID=UPI0032996180
MRCRVAQDPLATVTSSQIAHQGVEVHRATVGRFLHRLGLSNKKPQGRRASQTGDRKGT